MKILVSAIALAGLIGLGVTSASAKNSAAYCDGYARDVARQQAGGNAVGGAVVGGVGGAVLGGILGGKKAVAPGAIAGAVGGGVIGGASWKRAYDRAYYQCLNAPPVYVAPPPPAYIPPVGSYQWVQMCDAKYKTFNPKTGYYIAKYDAYNQPVYRVCSLP